MNATVNKMIMVNKAEVTRTVAGEKEQMRNIDQLLPLHTVETLEAWSDEGQKEEDLQYYKVKCQEEQDDLWCDKGECLLSFSGSTDPIQ